MLRDIFWIIIAFIIAIMALIGIILKVAAIIIAIIAWLL